MRQQCVVSEDAKETVLDVSPIVAWFLAMETW